VCDCWLGTAGGHAWVGLVSTQPCYILEHFRGTGKPDYLERHLVKRGECAVIRSRIGRATGDVIMIQDADLEDAPADLPALMKPIVDGKANAVFGSRPKAVRTATWPHHTNKESRLKGDDLKEVAFAYDVGGTRGFRPAGEPAVTAWRWGGRFTVRATAMVWALAVGLRVLLAFVNGSANDDHISVIQVIAYEYRIPADGELWEAFQPKLYHLSVALTLRALPVLPTWAQVRVAQAISCTAGVATLILVLAFLRTLEVSDRTRLATFALVALNPKMIATSVQATNDAFVILCVSATIFFGYRFYGDGSVRSFLWMTVGAVFAGIAKGNGLVVSIAIVCVLAALVLRPPRDGVLGRRRTLGFAIMFLVTFSATVPVLGEYWSKYEQQGTPFAVNQAPAPPPQLATKSYVRRPGVTSVLDGFFTLKLIDMLREPIVTIGVEGYPPYRTSVWSLLYGETHSVHFDAWPPGWESRTTPVQWLARMILLLGLIPTGVLVMGFFRQLWAAARWVTTRVSGALPIQRLYLAVTATGYVAFVLLYSYRMRDFSATKIIFVYPAMLAFAACTAFELDRVASAVQPSVRRLVFANCAALCCAYVIDVLLLIEQLIVQHLQRS